MSKACQSFFCCLLLLANFSPSAIPAESKDESIESFTTVATRRQKLTELIAEREQAQVAGDQVTVIRLSNRIVELYLKLYEFDSALTQSQESLATARSVAGSGDARLLVDALILSARVYINRTQSTNALPLLKEALELSTNLGYRQGEAQSQAQLAAAYYELGRRGEAEASNEQALRLAQEVQDKRVEAFALTTQAYLLMLDDKPAETLVILKDAESIWRSLDDRAELANALVDQNLLAIRQGQWQDGLKSLYEAQELMVDNEAEPFLAGKIADSFGEIYEAYGQLDTALTYFREALNYFRDGAHDVQGTVTASYKVARVQARLGNYDEAKQQMAQSLAAAQETKNDLTIGLWHENLARVWLAENSYESARLEFLNAISYFTKGKNARLQARAELYLGQTEHLLGNLAQAGANYQKALRFFTQTSDYTNEAALRFGLGKLALEQGQLDKAQEHLTRSIELTELLRENASSKDLRSSFLHSVHDRYETYVEWLMTRYDRDRTPQNAIKAFEAAEVGRARSLLDSLDGYQQELRQASDSSLLVEEEKFQKQELRLVDERTALLSHGGTENERAGVEQELREVRGKLEALEARINSSTKIKDLLRPTPLSYEQIRADITDTQTSLLSYSLGDGKSFAWVVTKDGLNTYELPAKSTIEAAARKLITLLETPAANEAEQAKLQFAIDEVSRLVIEPLAAKLKTPRLIVVADGVLQYIPFQILNTSVTAKEPLIAICDIIDAPSASALAIVRRERMKRQPGSKLLVGFGDAVYSADYSPQPIKADTTSSEGRSRENSRLRNLPRLFYAKRELREIGELAGSDAMFYVETNATREKFLNVDLSQFRILHVVTHGVLDDQQPELSGLVLSLVDANARPIDGFVSLADIYKLHAPVDLVVLSACHTALGAELRGEGLVGLTRGFMYAGASGVVASLWKVDDRATAELMKYFYTNMLQRGMGPAAALRAAQNEIRSQPKWSSPYYWAGFTFQGDYDLTIQSKPPAVRLQITWLIVSVSMVVLLGAAGYSFLRYRRRIRFNA